jgi:hypothetical protein
MSDGYDNLERAVGALLAKESSSTPEQIRNLIRSFGALPECAVTLEEAEQLAKEFEVRHGVTMTIGAVLKQPDFKPWLSEAKIDIDPYYWQRYAKLLTEKKLSGHVIATLDNVTDRILGLLENPMKPGPWDRRGMVVGHVQSGKTANYIGLMCKAADAGYGVIIVIAGIHNRLRNQTQERIDEGFVGRDSSRLLAKHGDRYVGVGRYDKTRRPITFTNSKRDFNKAMATAVGVPLQALRDPAVFVIKKNSSTLGNLLQWLEEHSRKAGAKTIEAPMLLIDDEADNASINIKHGKNEVSKINGQIRSLLQLFERSCYVGYTATPFANIFIDPDTDNEMLGEDLFPRDFIISLDPPSNYFGPTKVFLDDSEDVICNIDDNEDVLPIKHPKDFQVTSLPPSLLHALRTYVVARAIRLARGHESVHSSMLVNASRFTNVQRQLRDEIHRRLKLIQSSVRLNGALPAADALQDPEIEALHDAWQAEYGDTEFDWDAVQPLLNAAAAPISVFEVNSRATSGLDYAAHKDTGLNAVAVGGFSLSRGLTLEGLMVTYFLRNSIMYDTLMQMGRWFGYRPEYEDLCRVWMPEEAQGWYMHIAESIEMLRDELRAMDAAKATPQEFGLKVRSHPDTLIVTARNKMGSGEKVVVRIGLQNAFIETATLSRQAQTLDANRRVAAAFASRLEELGHPVAPDVFDTGGHLLRNIPVAPVSEFVAGFANHPGSPLTEPGPVCKYIEDRREGELASWDVLFASRQQAPDEIPDESLGIPIYCQRRAVGLRSDGATLRVGNKQRVASRGIEKTGLTPEQVAAAEAAYLETHGANANFPDHVYREVRRRPLLIVHLLEMRTADGPSAERPVVAWSISFPKTDVPEKRVEYVVNTPWLRENEAADLEEDEIGGDLD